jgi:hypothetical protein
VSLQIKTNILNSLFRPGAWVHGDRAWNLGTNLSHWSLGLTWILNPLDPESSGDWSGVWGQPDPVGAHLEAGQADAFLEARHIRLISCIHRIQLGSGDCVHSGQSSSRVY